MIATVYAHPMDEPHAVWCEEHLLPCRLQQTYAFELAGEDGEPTVLELRTFEIHT